MMVALLLPAAGLVGCGSSGASVAATTGPGTAAPVSVSSIPPTVPTAPAPVGNDNSHSGGGGKNGGGGGGGKNGGTTGQVDVITVTKCETNGSEMLIKASSSDPLAQLEAFLPDGTNLGLVQNGGGSRYGGTVKVGLRSDPGEVTIRSSSGGSITVKTGPFQPGG
jgi:hypothetical protein